MGDRTGIEWTDTTWNPIRGCSRVSEGCRNCYAEQQAARIVRMGASSAYSKLVRLTTDGEPRWTGVVELDPATLAHPLCWRKPRRIFVNSMSDLFHESLTNDQIAAVFGVIAACPQHTFQILTKRAKRMREWFEVPGIAELVEMFRQIALAGRIEEYFAPERVVDLVNWPGYAATSKGRVISNRKGPDYEMKIQRGEQGHGRVKLYHPNGHDERALVHRLVLEAFDRAPRDSEQGCHITGDATNNALWNLRWGTQSDNWDDSKRHGTRRRYSKLTDEQVDELRQMASEGTSFSDLGRQFGISDTQAGNIVKGKQWTPEYKPEWPLRSAWLGVSVENQHAADERIPDLLDTPAAVRFLSCEPLLGPLYLTPYLAGVATRGVISADGTLSERPHPPLDWLIAGCESGRGARACDVVWLRSLRDQCLAAGVPLFLKQAVETNPFNAAIHNDGIGCGNGSKRKAGSIIGSPYLDGRQWLEFPEVPA